MNGDDWLSSLEVGSEVFVYSPWVTGAIKKVERLTRTMVFVGNRRYHRATGREVGGDRWGVYGISPVTQEIRDKQLRKVLIERITASLDKATPLDALRAAYEILCKEQP